MNNPPGPVFAPQNVARLHDWLGVWSMDPAAAFALWSEVQRTDWLAHFAAFESKPARLESTVVMAAGEGGKAVAVVPLVGTLLKGRSSFGGTSTVQARRDIASAAANPDVSGILLSIDSPGGTVAGTDELGQAVKAARRRKPVFAQINDLGASAAYWVASQASRVYANSPTALVGSIGTMLAVRKDTSGSLAVFTSGPLKAPGANGDLSDQEKAHLQALVMGWQGEFGAAVKSGRRMTDAQLERVSTGAVFLAKSAGELKLIDGVQSEQTTLAELAAAR
jgi:signal peptide peptidase SppA